MPLEFPFLTDRPERADHQYKDVIQSGKESELVQTVNHGWATTGIELGAWSWGSVGWSTDSVSYVTANDEAGIDLDQINPLVEPSRTLWFATTSVTIVEFEAIGDELDLEIEIIAQDGNGRPESAPTDTVVVEITSETAESGFAYSLLEPGSYVLRLRGRTNGKDALLNQFAVRELPLENLAFDYPSNLVARGTFWVGPFADGGPLRSLDSDGAQDGFVANTWGTMERDTFATDVHSFGLSGDEDFDTSSNHDLSGTAGLLVGIAFKKDVEAPGPPIYKTASNSEGYAFWIDPGPDVFGVAIVHSDTAYWASWEGDIPDVDEWHDVVFHYSTATGRLRVWVDGAFVASATISGGGPLDDTSGFIHLGHDGGSSVFEGSIAMPEVYDFDPSDREIQRYIQWRRSIHGLPGAAATASVSVSPSTFTVSSGNTYDLNASIVDIQGNSEDLPDTDFNWSSDDTNIATVDSSGVVTGVAAGSVNITASKDGLSDSSSGTVTDAIQYFEDVAEQIVTPSNIRVHYRFDETGIQAGNSAFDATSNNDHGTYDGSPSGGQTTLVTDGDGTAVQWAAGEGPVKMPLIGRSILEQNATIGFCVQDPADGPYIYFEQVFGGGQAAIWAQSNSGTWTIEVQAVELNNGSSFTLSGTLSDPTTPTWIHVKHTSGGLGGAELFIDGSSVDTATGLTATSTPTAQDIASDASGSSWTGTLDEFSVFEGGLTSTQISDLYDGGTGNPP